MCLKIKCRPAGAGMLLTEAMSQLIEIENIDDLIKVYNSNYYGKKITADDLSIKYWGIDKRINWKTYLICINNDAAFFTDGLVKGIQKCQEEII